NIEMESVDKAVNSRDNLWTNVAWALKFIWQSGRGLTLAIVALTVIQSVVPLIGLYLTKLVLDDLTAAITSSGKTVAFNHISFLILLSAAVLFLDRSLGTLVELARNAHTLVATDRMYEILHAKSITVDLEYYDNSDYYDALHRAQGEASYRPTRILDGIFSSLQSGISVVAIGALLLSFHWSVPVVLILATIPDLLLRL